MESLDSRPLILLEKQQYDEYMFSDASRVKTWFLLYISVSMKLI